MRYSRTGIDADRVAKGRDRSIGKLVSTGYPCTHASRNDKFSEHTDRFTKILKANVTPTRLRNGFCTGIRTRSMTKGVFQWPGHHSSPQCQLRLF